MFVVAAAVVVAVWELRKGFLAKGIDLPEQPLMLGGVVMVVVAYFYGAPALVTATAVTALVIMLWLLRRGVDGYVQNATASVFTLIYVPFLGSFVALLLAEGGATDFDRWDVGRQGHGHVHPGHHRLRHRRLLRRRAVRPAPDGPGHLPEEVLGGLRRLARLLRRRRLGAGHLPPRGRLVGRRRARPDRGRHGHPRRPVRVRHQARPRHQGHEPGDPRTRRPDGPAGLDPGDDRRRSGCCCTTPCY